MPNDRVRVERIEAAAAFLTESEEDRIEPAPPALPPEAWTRGQLVLTIQLRLMEATVPAMDPNVTAARQAEIDRLQAVLFSKGGNRVVLP